MSLNLKGKSILIIDDDFILRSSLEEHIRDLSEVRKIVHAENGKRGLARILEEEFDFVFLDVDMPLMNGIEVLKQASQKKVNIFYIVMTAYGKISDAVECMKYGAFTYLEKPLKPKSLENILLEIKESQQMIQQLDQLSPLAFEEGKEIRGSGSQLSKTLKLIQKVSSVNTAVLIRGESGTGKELAARAIHFNSDRKKEAFVTTNCSAIPETLFESEFFGHEKGSFTGATEKRIGKFQYAERGTLFLDEIGDLSLNNQVKLLRVLQEKKYSPLGSNLEIPYNVRIVAATHQDLEEMVKEKKFRQDLYFRLNIMSIYLPSLKERKEDIPELIMSFIQKFNTKHHKQIQGCTPEFLDKIKDHTFPGNIRELENAIERAFVLSEGNWLEASSLPNEIMESTKETTSQYSDSKKRSALPSGDAPSTKLLEKDSSSPTMAENELLPQILVDSSDLDFQKNKEEFEKKFIIEALKRNKGMLNQTALHANIPKKTLQRKIQKYGIDLSEFKKNK